VIWSCHQKSDEEDARDALIQAVQLGGKLEEKTKRLEDRHFWKRCMQLQSATGTDAMCAPNFSADKSIAAAITVNHSRLLFKSSFPDRISTLEPKA
jgi:hypothetical protein